MLDRFDKVVAHLVVCSLAKETSGSGIFHVGFFVSIPTNGRGGRGLLPYSSLATTHFKGPRRIYDYQRSWTKTKDLRSSQVANYRSSVTSYSDSV
jgi:hypothetical protein